ncbi:DUF5685 family protein [Zongyangia hominis]|uniref:Uncharacterized protein n=1 Tax=Zongyangia hominis TaxID=2763677 RepID=A0A926EDL2_9FIRM|nr:DUF5685 family protein [Zongyangia hominis]MBC8571135.1 hypothetical protein [Zongyangia hominis]
MFGYVRPCKPELKIKEFEIYQSVYCGLCKQLGRSFGYFARFTLNYDFAFLAMLDMALDGSCPRFERQRCFANPLKKKNCCLKNPSLAFSADVAQIMLYYKVRDDMSDGGFLGKLRGYLLLPFVGRARKKAAKRRPKIDEIMKESTERQAALEQAGCQHVDEAAHPSAEFLSRICEEMARDERQKRVLGRFGYLLGRWIYLIDALDDMDEDLEKGNYNPFLAAYQIKPGEKEKIEKVAEEAKGSLNLTTAEIGAAYELLDIQRFRPIFDNVIYLGFADTMNQIRTKRSKQHE